MRKVYADDPAWRNIDSEDTARKIVEDEAIKAFRQIEERFPNSLDVLLGRSLGTFAIACLLERSLVSPKKIRLVPYDGMWTLKAASEIELILSIFPNIAFEIEHIGSTAIPGIFAKPIIDLLIGVDSILEAERFVEPLEKMGYIYWRENPERAHFYFVKELPLAGGTGRTHHVHIYEKNQVEFREKVFFRNHLKAHPDVAKAYEQLKMGLADNFANDRERYTEAKTDFIQSIVKLQSREIRKIAIIGNGGGGKPTVKKQS